MPVIKCAQCQQFISDRALECPYCVQGMVQESDHRDSIAWAVGLALLIVVAITGIMYGFVH